jgi:hypothetical protein
VIAEDAHRDAGAAVVVPVDETRVGLDVAGQDPLDDDAIADVYHVTPIN